MIYIYIHVYIYIYMYIYIYRVSEKDNTNIFPNETFLLLVRLLWFWCMLKLWCMHMLLGMVYSPYSLLESDTWTWTSELSIFECVLLRNHRPNILISLPTKWKHASMASVFHENCHTTLLRDSPKSSFGGVTLGSTIVRGYWCSVQRMVGAFW